MEIIFPPRGEKKDFELTLSGLLNVLLSMSFPAWKFEREPMENHEEFDWFDLTLELDLMDEFDLIDLPDPKLDVLIDDTPETPSTQ